MSKARGRERSTTLPCTWAYTKMNNMVEDKIKTTENKRKQSPDTGVEPETSDMPRKKCYGYMNLGHLGFLMQYPTIRTHR